LLKPFQATESKVDIFIYGYSHHLLSFQMSRLLTGLQSLKLNVNL